MINRQIQHNRPVKAPPPKRQRSARVPFKPKTPSSKRYRPGLSAVFFTPERLLADVRADAAGAENIAIAPDRTNAADGGAASEAATDAVAPISGEPQLIPDQEPVLETEPSVAPRPEAETAPPSVAASLPPASASAAPYADENATAVPSESAPDAALSPSAPPVDPAEPASEPLAAKPQDGAASSFLPSNAGVKPMTRQELTEKIVQIKREKGWTWKQICDEIGGMSPVLIVGALLGQHRLVKPLAKAAAQLFGLSEVEERMLNEVPMRGAGMPAVPTDPLIYRFYEVVLINGPAWKALIEEEFGDGIMSAIDFDFDIERQPDPKGDRVKINMSGKFLPYKYYGATQGTPALGLKELDEPTT